MGHHTGHPVWLSLGGTARRSVHDLQVAVAQEGTGTAKAIEHAGTADQSGVGVGINIDLYWGVHGDTTQTADRLRCIGDRERTQSDLVEIFIHVIKEFRETRFSGERE